MVENSSIKSKEIHHLIKFSEASYVFNTYQGYPDTLCLDLRLNKIDSELPHTIHIKDISSLNHSDAINIIEKDMNNKDRDLFKKRKRKFNLILVSNYEKFFINEAANKKEPLYKDYFEIHSDKCFEKLEKMEGSDDNYQTKMGIILCQLLLKEGTRETSIISESSIEMFEKYPVLNVIKFKGNENFPTDLYKKRIFMGNWKQVFIFFFFYIFMQLKIF